MSATTFIGKTLIALAFILQAYLLLTNAASAHAFNLNATEALSSCSWIPAEIASQIQYYLRIVTVGLLATSVLLALTKMWFFKITALLGVLILFWVDHHKTVLAGSFNINNEALWGSISVIGTLIYLLGAECSCSKTQNQSNESPKKVESKPEPKVDRESREDKKKKRN